MINGGFGLVLDGSEVQYYCECGKGFLRMQAVSVQCNGVGARAWFGFLQTNGFSPQPLSPIDHNWILK